VEYLGGHPLYPNTSTLSNREIAVMIMDNKNFSDWKEAYIKIVKRTQRDPLESISLSTSERIYQIGERRKTIKRRAFLNEYQIY
jgi:hypothetical protein